MYIRIVRLATTAALLSAGATGRTTFSLSAISVSYLANTHRRFCSRVSGHHLDLRRVLQPDLLYRGGHQPLAKCRAVDVWRYCTDRAYLPARECRTAICLADVAACRIEICGRGRDGSHLRR